MLTHRVVAAVSDRRRRSEIDATIYVPSYNNRPTSETDSGIQDKLPRVIGLLAIGAVGIICSNPDRSGGRGCVGASQAAIDRRSRNGNILSMVQDVCRIEADLELNILPNIDGSPERKIDIEPRGTTQSIVRIRRVSIPIDIGHDATIGSS